jgi:hypothetical protein
LQSEKAGKKSQNWDFSLFVLFVSALCSREELFKPAKGVCHLAINKLTKEIKFVRKFVIQPARFLK